MKKARGQPNMLFTARGRLRLRVKTYFRYSLDSDTCSITLCTLNVSRQIIVGGLKLWFEGGAGTKCGHKENSLESHPYGREYTSEAEGYRLNGAPIERKGPKRDR